MSAGGPGLEVAIGIALFILVRWLSRRPRTGWSDWVTLRIGSVPFAEVLAAFLIGYGVGGLLTPQPDAVGPGVPGRFGFGRPGLVDPGRLPTMLGLVAAVIAVLLRVDLADVLFRGSSPNSLSILIGQECRVIATIEAGSVGKVAVRDASGQLISADATADSAITSGTVVHVTGTKDRLLVVAPAAGAPQRTANAAGGKS